jgi:hypothetical protein
MIQTKRVTSTQMLKRFFIIIFLYFLYNIIYCSSIPWFATLPLRKVPSTILVHVKMVYTCEASCTLCIEKSVHVVLYNNHFLLIFTFYFNNCKNINAHNRLMCKLLLQRQEFYRLQVQPPLSFAISPVTKFDSTVKHRCPPVVLPLFDKISQC